MLLTPPPDVRETIVDLRLGGRPGFPFPGWARDGPGGLGFDSPPEGRSSYDANRDGIFSARRIVI